MIDESYKPWTMMNHMNHMNYVNHVNHDEPYEPYGSMMNLDEPYVSNDPGTVAG